MAPKTKAKTAKTASKNSPDSRKGSDKFKFNGVLVTPALFISASGNSYIAVQEKDGKRELILDSSGMPYRWHSIQKEIV